ncbi:SRA stem-loop-interacting RNA-binding protein: mitochondrial-like isoform X2 [Dinothrombium tinctorium]|uniref:SRA stem-loop-interacting RNA-binding protein: mitochondrial-like isoform X2 n=1 Tax=Dinothrombium tinctorium TaxID=1965070 RepID=A0A3S4QQR0_9ACAR|nr:SRA stem-loop-interacting RNA-binding protein: mitochondrial-like isoform X2 [Dinothrombium tinctorium]
MRFSVLVRRIPWTVSTVELREHFSQFGKVVRVNIPYDKSKGLHSGYGFVTFNSQNAYKSALSERHVLEGGIMTVFPGKDSQPVENDE